MLHFKEQIQKLADDYLPEIIEIRRYLHAHPELSQKEYQTSAYIISRLEEYAIPYKKGIAGSGVVGLIEGSNPSSMVIALRADMDALPVEEKNNVPYKSEFNGVMHACGHDVHMACLLGAAKIIKKLCGEFNGTVKLIFQPSEEKYPGGAISMINAGVLENPHVDVIIGQHVFPDLEAGDVGMKAGKYMASSDEVYFTVKGLGGHGATPHLNIDPVIIASHIVVALQTITSRYAFPVNPTVFSIGKFIAEGKTNIIPDEVKMEGTLRTYNDAWRKKAIDRITQIAQSIAHAYGGVCDVFVDNGYPFLYNDPDTTVSVKKSAEEFLGKEHVHELEMRMTSEDFAYYSQRIPACLYRLGVRNEARGITSNLHSAWFDVDERSIGVGTGLMAWIAICELNQKS
jgi:amidohydrolase